jgi:hypothetical protein
VVGERNWGKGIHGQLGCNLEGCSFRLCICLVVSSGNDGRVSLVIFAVGNAYPGREVQGF